MGGTTSTTNTSQQQKVELPAWVNDASQQNYQFAKDVAGRPLQQYEGQRVADPSAMTTQGYGLIQSNVGSLDPLFNKATGSYDTANKTFGTAADLYKSTAPIYDEATGQFRKASGILDQANPLISQAAGVYGDTTKPLDITSYLNPYTNEVENRTINNANTALTQQLANISSNAQKAGGWGGSRFAVQQGVAQGEGVRQIGDLTAALRSADVKNATDTALADRTGRQAGAAGLLGAASGYGNLASGVSNTGTGLLNVASGIGNTASGLTNVGTGQANTGAGYLNTAAGKGASQQQDITNLMTAGQQEQANRQSQINAAMDKFKEAWNYPTEQLNMRLAALGMSPYGKTTTGTGTQSTETPTDWATVGLGGLKTIMGGLPTLMALSDRKTKTDITKLTDDDIPMYAYRYKGDPKSYPKIVGPMAQDIEKKYPKAVKKVGKFKTIHLGNLMDALR